MSLMMVLWSPHNHHFQHVYSCLSYFMFVFFDNSLSYLQQISLWLPRAAILFPTTATQQSNTRPRCLATLIPTSMTREPSAGYHLPGKLCPLMGILSTRREWQGKHCFTFRRMKANLKDITSARLSSRVL